MVKDNRKLNGGIITLLLFLALLPGGVLTFGQATSFNYFYRVYFKDKGDYSVMDFSATDLLSQKAIDRRNKSGIEVPQYNDLPVNKGYINQIRSLGFKLHCTSKWLNTALFKTGNPADLNSLLSLSFVKDAKLVKRPGSKSTFQDKLDFEESVADLPPYDRPLSMINGYSLHNSGYDGKGIVIAVLDGGFLYADLLQSLSHLRARNGIKGTRDFVAGSGSVYGYHNHGTAVLSVLAGIVPYQLAGTAPGSDYWLLRTEDTSSESPAEEDFWAAAAEFADSLGADIISSSLGYYAFDDPEMNYKFTQLDGNTAFITKAADAAASKGILVVVSAGNERNKTWLRIVAPSDGDSLITVGAVDGYNAISSFSSAGPSADNRVKPDIVAQGVSVPIQTSESIVTRGNGTSFSCPVISGMCACVMQAVPESKNTDIITALQKSADKFSSPDSLYGYGIPDMTKTLGSVEEKYILQTGSPVFINPNPFTGLFEITFSESPETLQIEILTLSGKTVAVKKYNTYISRTIIISDLEYREQGLYIIRIRTSAGVYTSKVIKIEN